MHQQQLVPEPIILNYDDYCAMPDDGKRYEILNGDLYMSPAPHWPHQRLVGNLFLSLVSHVDRNDLGRVILSPFDVILDPHNIVQPDLIFVQKSRLSIITDRGIFDSPDLVIEILSPGTSARDQRDKRNIYAQSRVPHYWMMDPVEPRVVELQLSDKAYALVKEVHGDEVFEPKLFPGLKISLSDLVK
ncbi:MAG TPA: Uma2 family endonuclease [Phycisphaerae bacterium]|nr:Uma2 family endonuclease [Phycisphaerae bacterium]